MALSEIDQALTAATEARTRLSDAILALEELRAAHVAQVEEFRRQRDNQGQEIINLRHAKQAAEAERDALRDAKRDNA